jgi:beta-glucosidase-like glycosyl hydrolase
VHSGPELLRHGFIVDVSPHDLEDTYLPAFRATVAEAHAPRTLRFDPRPMPESQPGRIAYSASAP